MPQDLSCLKCKHVFPVTEARPPFGVQCPACDAHMTAEFRKVAAPTPGQSPYEVVAKLGKPPAAGAATEKAMKLDDDEEEKRHKGGSMTMVIIAASTALLITLGGLGTAGYFMFSEEGLSTYSYTSSGGGGGNPKGGNTGGGGNPKGGNPGGGNPNKGGTPGIPSGGSGEFARKDLKFTAVFPSQPKEQSKAGGKMFLLENGDNGYLVIVTDVPVTDKLSQAQADSILDGARDGALKNSNTTAKIKNNISITVGKQKYSGREVFGTVTQPKQMEMWAKFFLVGKRVYTVWVLGPKEFVTSPEASQFMESFRVTD